MRRWEWETEKALLAFLPVRSQTLDIGFYASKVIYYMTAMVIKHKVS